MSLGKANDRYKYFDIEIRAAQLVSTEKPWIHAFNTNQANYRGWCQNIVDGNIKPDEEAGWLARQIYITDNPGYEIRRYKSFREINKNVGVV